jgi:hypothetical protein
MECVVEAIARRAAAVSVGGKDLRKEIGLRTIGRFHRKSHVLYHFFEIIHTKHVLLVESPFFGHPDGQLSFRRRALLVRLSPRRR